MKPKTTDGVNYTLHGCTLQVLTADDIILPTDFIRDLYESPMMSESGGWDTTYKGEAWRGPMWHIAKKEMPGWCGKTYREFLEFGASHREVLPKEVLYEHEIVRVLSHQTKVVEE